MNLVLAGSCTAKEWVEDLLLFLPRNSGTMVGHADFDAATLVAGAAGSRDPDPVAAFQSILGSVAYQVLESVPQGYAIA